MHREVAPVGWYNWESLSKRNWPTGLPAAQGLGSLDGQKKVVSWNPQAAAQQVQIVEVPDGEAGTDATVGIMANLAYEAARDPAFILFAQSIIRDAGLASKDFRGELEALFNYVCRNVRYEQDPRNLEWIQSPYFTLLVRGAGDCDDYASLLVALAMALGHGGAFRAYRADPARPGEFSHIVPRLGYRTPQGAVWLTADATNLADRRLGWDPSPDRYYSSKDWVVGEP